MADLVRVLGVSDMTIRRDIEALAERGLLAKVHGGAIAIEGTTDEPGYAAKSEQQREEKLAIARAAATLVKPGSAVGISAGTTTAALARLLVAAARRLVVLADHTKWDMIGIATIAPLGEAHIVVTDSGLPVDVRAELGLSVDELIIAEVGEPNLEWAR